MRDDKFDKLMSFLDRLEQAKISYTLARHRDEALMINIAVPGERWEVEFLTDGSVEVERFVSSGEIQDEAALEILWAEYADFEETTENVEILQRLDVTPAVESG